MSDSRLLLQLLMLDAGIVPDIPLDSPSSNSSYDPWGSWNSSPPDSINQLLSSVDPGSRRKMTRKFRKLWKKAEKAYCAGNSSSSSPRQLPKSRRRAIVKRLLRDLNDKS